MSNILPHKLTKALLLDMAAGTRGAEGAAAPPATGLGLRFSLCSSIIPNILDFCDSFVINYTINWPEICGCVFLHTRSASLHLPLTDRISCEMVTRLILDSDL